MVDEEKEMSSNNLIITGDYSDYNILEEERILFPKKMMSGSKQKINMERKSAVISLQQRKIG